MEAFSSIMSYHRDIENSMIEGLNIEENVQILLEQMCQILHNMCCPWADSAHVLKFNTLCVVFYTTRFKNNTQCVEF